MTEREERPGGATGDPTGPEDNEIGFRNVDEEESHDEAGSPGPAGRQEEPDED